MGLNTVRVPPELEALFASAEKVVSQYFRERRDHPEQGTIEIFGERYVLVRGASLSVEFFRLVHDLYGPGREDEAASFARNILFDLAHAIGRSDARNFHRKMGLEDPIARLSAGPVHFAHTGWAFVDIFAESRPTPDEEYFLVYDHPYSFESDAWMRAGQRSSFPVCIMNAGYSSGWCEESFGVELVSSEILCRAKGDDHCRFVMAPPQRIEERVRSYFAARPELSHREPSWEIPDFFARKRLEEELRKSRDELEERVKERTAELSLANERLQREMIERGEVELRLRQAHKMEAVGRLAGGIAHDFNNLLTAILGWSELAAQSLSGGDAARGCVLEIQAAAERAAALTRQMLAFSRQQVLSPSVIDLNAIVTNMATMLGRLIGEDVELATSLHEPLGRVLADPGQIEQVIVNLAVNARDAMPKGGRLSLETAEVEVKDTRREGLEGLAPGRWVRLSVRDTGSGMDAATLAHVFEPFFTTKERGKGTGLGLATVHGIVTASGGAIHVQSAPGAGTTFHIHLPRLEAPAIEPAAPLRAPASRHVGVGTVLLVEDEESVRRLLQSVLERNGYTVVEAGDPWAALQLFHARRAEIDLLLTDMVMPGLNGQELAERIRAERPDLPVLFMSGYTDETIDRRGVHAAGADFIQKPYTLDALLRKVHDVLGASPIARDGA